MLFIHVFQIFKVFIVSIRTGLIFHILAGVLFGTNHVNMQKAGKRLAIFFEIMGPIYIKMGQFLSTRPDLIGQDMMLGLAKLQDRVPPFDAKIVLNIIEKELSSSVSDLFKDFSLEPVAAASIAQVHRAVMHDDTVIAVKILRPHVVEYMSRDIKLLKFFAKLFNLHKSAKRLKLKEVIATLEQILKIESNLRLEAAACAQMQENLKSDPNVHIPSVYWQYTTQKIFAMEWIEGIPAHDVSALKKAGHDLHSISRNIATTFFNQAFRDGFFHADIHPGNILINNEGQICFVDFGIMGYLDHKNQIFIAEILHGFVTRDYEKVAKIHFEAGYVPKTQDIRLFALVCRSIGEPIIGLPVSQISIANLLKQLFDITKDFNMETQPQLLLLQKTMVTIEGMGHVLYPEVNMWQLIEPWITKWAAENMGICGKFQDLRAKLPELWKALEGILKI